MVQLVDILPTCLDLAGLSPPEYVQGQNLLAGVGRESVFAAIGGVAEPRASFPQGMPKRGVHREVVVSVRTASHKFVLDPENGNELYDLRDDPCELSNLILAGESPSQALTQALSQWQDSCAEIASLPGISRY